MNNDIAGAFVEDGVYNLPKRNGDGQYEVWGFVYVRKLRENSVLQEHRRVDPNQEYVDTFDLEQQQRDLCLRVVGANTSLHMPFYLYRSNLVRVPAEDIAAVFRSSSAIQTDSERKDR